jgi:hypothetical protein
VGQNGSDTWEDERRLVPEELVDGLPDELDVSAALLADLLLARPGNRRYAVGLGETSVREDGSLVEPAAFAAA